MGRQYDIEDADSSTLADSATLIDSTLSTRSVVARCRNLLDWFTGRRPGHSDRHEQHGHDSLGGKHRTLRCCVDGVHGSEEPSPLPLFVRDDSEYLDRKVPSHRTIKLSVSGMGCSGCEKALQRALQKIPSVKDIHTDMATAQALFCMDVNTISVDEVLTQLRRTTGYTIKLVDEAHEGSQFLYILTPDPGRLFRGPPPRGVKSCKQTGTDNNGKAEIRIKYDPRIILPRDLMEKELADANAELAPIPPPDSVSVGRKHLRRELVYFIIATVFTIPVLILMWAPLPFSKFAKQIACLPLATAVQVSAWEFYPNAFKNLYHTKLADMDILVVLSTTTAYIFSVTAFALYGTGSPLSTGSFFETSTLLVTLIRLGRYMAELARQKATESVSIRTLQAPTAQLLTNQRDETRGVDVRLLQTGDKFRVPPHTRIPTDGIVDFGGSEVDESMMTGESREVAKGIGSEVIAGTMNGTGTLDIIVTRMTWENSISQIGALVDNAELTKPKIQALADRVAAYFVPAIITVSTTVFLTWILVGIFHQKKRGADAVVDAISYAIATLIVSCPCAIGLAVPMVIVISSGVAAKHGVIFRAATAIEMAKSVKHVIFDKTGTLTEGKLVVEESDFLGKPEAPILGYLLGLVSGQKHPVSSAIAEWILSKEGLESVHFDTTKVEVGGGVVGKINGEQMVVRLGNCDWLGISSSDKVLNFISTLSSPTTESPVYQNSLDYTLLGMTINDELCAVFALRDALRPEADSVISSLQSRHISIHLVSGDDKRSVLHCGGLLNISPLNTAYRCSPADKAAYVANIQETYPQHVVLFIGDGTNDAVALTQATIGVAIAGGTDVAKSAANVVLARPDLRGLLVALDVSTRAVRRIRFNFAWAAIYNIFAVLLATGAFVWFKMPGKHGEEGPGLRIPPEFAGLGEIVSVLPVVLIAFSLRFAKFTRHGGQRTITKSIATETTA